MVTSYKVITWDFNSDSLEEYDIIPYFIRSYKAAKPKDRPTTFDEFREFVKREGKYQFWSRCEYEVIICGWPKHKNEEKIDVWKQIEMNLDTVTEILMNSVKK